MIVLLAQIPTPKASPTPAPPEPLFLLPTSAQISSFVSTLLISLAVAFLIYAILYYVLRPLSRKLEKEVALVTLNVSQIPLFIIFLLVSLKISFHLLASSLVFRWIENGLNALIVAATSYWVAQLFTQVIIYYLKKYAQQTEAGWDDVLLPILEATIPVIVYIFGGYLFLQSFGIDLTGIWVALGGVTFVLGFALQGILSNFFSGLVLLIDSPFQFGDVITLEDGSLAVIKQIGIRVTNLFLVDSNCELFIPNGNLQSQNIINLTRPAPHYFYSIELPLRADIEPTRAIQFIKEIVLGHPDTLGNIDEKLQVIDKYYKSRTDDTTLNAFHHRKKETGRQRLLAEKNVNEVLMKIHEKLQYLIDKIQLLEKGGLELKEVREIQGIYLNIAKLVGLELIDERQGKQKILRLEEVQDTENTLLGSVRTWYGIWSKDPDLTEIDPYYLQEEWERKIELLKLRLNKVYKKIAQPSVDERRLDDYVMTIDRWLKERFKNTQTLWQSPKIWNKQVAPGLTGDVTTIAMYMEYVVRYYVDNLKLEQCQRGNRIKSEVQGELIQQLRQIYIYR